MPKRYDKLTAVVSSYHQEVALYLHLIYILSYVVIITFE